MPTSSPTSTENTSPPDRTNREAFIRWEIRRRIEALNRIGGDREAQKTVLAHSKEYPLRWINDWVWLHEPRAQPPMPKRPPFRMWSCQEELVKFIFRRYDDGEAGGVKKSRDMGFSWTTAAIAVWFWLFQPDSSVTFGSRKEDKVDNLGDLDALLPKVRSIIDSLPPWMRPNGYRRSKHATEMRIRNPENDAVITGEVGDNMGRGGRSTIYFADEFAFVRRAEGVRGAIGGNTDCVIYGSTSNGVGTEFYQMEKSGRLPFFYLHWREHPHRDDEWKQQKQNDIGRANFAREYDMDDGAAIEDLLIPSNWVQEAREIELQRDGIRTAGLDVGGRGPDESAYTSRIGPVLCRCEAWDEPSTTKTARKAIRFAHEDGAELLRYDAVGIGAGVRSTLDEEAEGHLEPVPVVGGAEPTKTVYDDAPEKAQERFKNLVTEIWWSLRQRFKKVHEHVNGIDQHPEDEQISIDIDDSTLISQLSTRRYEEVGGMKVKAESKKKMSKRGVQSPDRADAAVYCFADAVRPNKVNLTQPAPVIR